MKSLAAAGLGVFVLLASVSAKTTAGTYNEANRLYRQGEYDQALKLYNSIGVVNPDVEHNRAMAWLRSGDIGRAMVHFNRAKRLRPGDEQTTAALEYVRSVKRDREPKSGGSALAAAAGLLYAPSLFALEWAAAGLCLLSSALAAGLMLARRPSRGRRFSRALAVSLALLAACGAVTAFRAVQFERGALAVVLADEAAALAEPSKAAKKVFALHEGTEGITGETRDGFVLFTLPSGLSGWVEKSKLERV
ncbi:MAG: tetratricopeptide repeat protein [Candidatus Nitrospinota bacterium M3_3B_026]